MKDLKLEIRNLQGEFNEPENRGIGESATVRSRMRRFTVSPTPRFALPLALLCLLSFAFGLCAQAQYAIDWFTMDGGGGTSTGGVFSVSGTIGQPDAGVMSGGQFTLVGGFWGIVAAIQTSDAPSLSVANLGSHVLLSWPMPADGWLLERTNILSGVAGPWTQVPPPYQTNSGVISVSFTNTPPVGNQFFRLHKP